MRRVAGRCFVAAGDADLAPNQARHLPPRGIPRGTGHLQVIDWMNADPLLLPHTDTRHAEAGRFLAAAAGWNLAFFAALRTDWFAAHIGLPFAALQQLVATWYSGGMTLPVMVTMECSGTDVMALSAGVILAYPATAARRLRGVAFVLPVLLVLNLIRIDTLARTVGTPSLFPLLHLYVWPAALMAAAALLVFRWMHAADSLPRPAGRAVWRALACLGVFAIATPFLASGALVAAACVWVAHASAHGLTALGADAVARGALLSTPRGAFIVTADCLLSPIIPLWVMAVLWWPLSRWQRFAGLALSLPIVAALAVTRLFVLAAPGAWVSAPLILVHGFHQLVLFAAIVVAASGHSAPRSGPLAPRVMKGLGVVAAAGVVAILAGGFYNAALAQAAVALSPIAPHALRAWWVPGDIQGALVLLPMYQLSLFSALLFVSGRPVAWRRAGLAVTALGLAQIALLVALGEAATHLAWQPHALIVRGWAVAAPLALAIWAGAIRAAEHTGAREAAYRRFWNHVGAEFPDLGGAASTAYYAANERRLIQRHLPNLAGQRILKTDLWDEARNTRILQWMQREGARGVGIDISGPVISLARREFRGAAFAGAGADVRALPFPDRTFDAIYSMGTVEHVRNPGAAIAECYRVLKPGGRVLLGVPNRHDPFLRPLLVALLYSLGLYDYGFEKSYSRRTLTRMLTDAGFTVVGDDGILFMPGWLRMLDLLFHTRMPALAGVTAAGVGLFEWIDAHVPAVRRHGYLVVEVGQRPADVPAPAAHPVFSPSGLEWLVDARGCDPALLRCRATLETLLNNIVAEVELTPVAPGLWHVFGGESGVTGVQLLRESHIACHTYPEAGYAAFSLYSCRSQPVEWPWASRLASVLRATDVSVRVVTRGPAAMPAATAAPGPDA